MKKKRWLCPLLALVFAAGLLSSAMPVDAASNVMLSAYGVATVDGEKDAKYDETQVAVLSRPNVGKISTWVLWDENYLYIFSEVLDSNIVSTPAGLQNPWFSDSVEYFVDRRNNKGGWDVDDFQLRVDNNGATSGMTSRGMSQDDTAAERNAITAMSKRTELGYNVEVSFPLSNQSVTVNGTDGMTVGFDIQLNNTNEPGIRESYLTWQGAGNANPAGWGNLKLQTVVAEEDRIPNTAEVTIENNANVALNKVAMMSIGFAWDKKPAHVNDGNIATAAQGCENILWEIQIDLAYETAINRIVVYNGSGDYASSYELYYYHTMFKEWTLIDTVTGVTSGKRVETTFDEISTRLIKIAPLTTVGGGTDSIWDFYGYAINEIEIYAARTQVITLDAPVDRESIFSTDGKDGVIPYSDSGYQVYRGHTVKDTNRTLNRVLPVLMYVFIGLTVAAGGFTAYVLLTKHRRNGGGR